MKNLDDILKIGTVNLQNINCRSDDSSKNIHLEEVATHLQKEKFDILGTQELTRRVTQPLKEKLPEYKFVGVYRFGESSISRNIKLIDDFNENNNIVTNMNVVYDETNLLPFIPDNFKDLIKGITGLSLLPRIATAALIELEK